MNVGYVHTFEVPEGNVDKGRLKVSVVNYENVPVKGAAVRISYTGNPDNEVGEITTDSDGIAIFNDLSAPPIEYSMEPGNRQPFSEYDIRVTAPGYFDVNVSGSDMFSGEISLQNIRMTGRENMENNADYNIVIPVNTLYGDYPPKIDEAEIKPMGQSGEIVLDRVVVPEIVVVHDGPPTDSSADNYYVTYKDYIKNVASSEIYSTWPRQTIQANVLAIMSFTLNRVYTEWYRNQFYDFTITSSTAYDQKWVNGRNVFESISQVVDDIFDNYISRPNVKQPILTQYCDGKRVTCPNRLSQWGSKYLGDQNYSSIEILRYYYGQDVYINEAEQISGIPYSWPGMNLDIGSSGQKVRQLQEQLNLIGEYYKSIPVLSVDGIYGEQTAAAVKEFQRIFNLPQSGITDFPTWFTVSEKYVALAGLAEL